MVTPGIVVGGVDSLFNSPSPPSVQQQGHGGIGAGGHRKRKKSLPPSHPPSSSRASIVFPILGGNPFTAAASQKKFDAEQSIGTMSLFTASMRKCLIQSETKVKGHFHIQYTCFLNVFAVLNMKLALTLIYSRLKKYVTKKNYTKDITLHRARKHISMSFIKYSSYKNFAGVLNLISEFYVIFLIFVHF